MKYFLLEERVQGRERETGDGYFTEYESKNELLDAALSSLDRSLGSKVDQYVITAFAAPEQDSYIDDEDSVETFLYIDPRDFIQRSRRRKYCNFDNLKASYYNADDELHEVEFSSHGFEVLIKNIITPEEQDNPDFFDSKFNVEKIVWDAELSDFEFHAR